MSWLYARSDGSTWTLRYDDLDAGAVRDEHYDTQAADLQALGLEWDGAAIRQSDRLDRYADAVEHLRGTGLLYECYCSRREIREAAQAPNRPLAGHPYPGTCAELDTASRAERVATGRPPALRIRAAGTVVAFEDRLAGPVAFELDDFVVVRNDGTPAYHLVTIVDDDDLGVELVVRADDLLDSTSRQLHLARVLGLASPDHAHVPLVVSAEGERLAKRHGAVTLADRAALGEPPARVLGTLAASLGLAARGESVADPSVLLDRFDEAALPRTPYVFDPDPDGSGQRSSSDTV